MAVDPKKAAAVAGKCSTPFGIRDHGGLVAPGSSWPDDQCSTPFGIRDHGGRGPIGTKELNEGAQRLSASEIMAER